MSDHDIVKTFVNILASQPVTFPDDFQEQPEKTLKKVPVLQVSTSAIDCPYFPLNRLHTQLEVPLPPELKKEEAHPSSGTSSLNLIPTNF